MKELHVKIITVCTVIVTTVTVIYFSYQMYTDYQDRKMVGDLIVETANMLKSPVKMPKSQIFPSSGEVKTAYNLAQAENSHIQTVTEEKLIPTDKDIRRYLKAWNMFMEKKYVGSYKDGYYTDSNIQIRGYDFWSNGIYAKFDSDEDGRHEIIFKVRGEKLVYVGILGEYNIFTATADDYRSLIGKTVDDFIEKYAKPMQKRESRIIELEDGRKEYQWKDENGVSHSIIMDK